MQGNYAARGPGNYRANLCILLCFGQLPIYILDKG
jgi:hypothetical protein